jgi:hypothetical protein
MEPLMSEARQAAVAGQFYPGTRDQLEQTLGSLIQQAPVKPALGIMVPHAGYVYSGAIAGEVYGAVEMPDLFVILGPNHTGLGPQASIMDAGIWRMPQGDAYIDMALAKAIMSHTGLLEADETAHSYEHSIEVQIPFLQYLKQEVYFVPISIMLRDLASCREIGRAIAAAAKDDHRRVLVVASSDMSHYETQEAARRKDEIALGRVLSLDPDGLLQTVSENRISMCGAAPVSIMLSACLELGATKCELVRYATSGDVSGDYSQVVGYAGAVVS